MRILQVNKFLYRRGGAESYMLDLVELLRCRGHDVEMFGMHHPNNPAELPLAGTFPPHIELDPPPTGTTGARAAARMMWSTSSRRGMVQAVRAFAPDIVHCHNIYHQLSPSVLDAAREAGVPCVLTLHDYKLVCPAYQLLDDGRTCDACVTGGPLQALRHRCKGGSRLASALVGVESAVHRALGAYGAVDLFISPSRFLAETTVRAGVYPERLRVVPHFADGTDVRATEGPDSGVVFAGRLSREKGIDVLIRALAQLPPQVVLRVAGDGPERAQLERLAEQVVPGRVRFYGRLGKVTLLELLRSSAVCAVPSRWHENQPMIVLEAFATGTPVVATTLGGLPELVRDGEDGLLVPPDDPDALAAALDRLLSEPRAARTMGHRARVRVEREFSRAAHLDRLEAVYAEAIRGHGPARVRSGA